MAIVAHLVERAEADGDNQVRDGVRAVIIGIDDTVDTTAALIQTRAATVCTTNGLNIPDGYFTSNRLISTTYDAADDVTVLKSSTLVEVIA